MTDWTPIPGFSKYQAHPDGLVRSVGLTRNGGRPHVRKPTPNRDGYLQVGLRDDAGRLRTVSVHQLVAWTFLGPQPPGLEVNHKDGNKRNCAAVNLEYTTEAGNRLHAMRTGLNRNLSGDQARNLRYRFAEIEVMRALRGRGWKLNEIATAFGASKGHVSELVRGLHRAAA